MTLRSNRTVMRVLAGSVLASAILMTAALAEMSQPTGNGRYGGIAGCPPGFTAERADGDLERFDRNHDGIVCTRDVPGRGNTGDGRVAKDNN